MLSLDWIDFNSWLSILSSKLLHNKKVSNIIWMIIVFIWVKNGVSYTFALAHNLTWTMHKRVFKMELSLKWNIILYIKCSPYSYVILVYLCTLHNDCVYVGLSYLVILPFCFYCYSVALASAHIWLNLLKGVTGARTHSHTRKTFYFFLLQYNTYILINVKSLWYEYSVNFTYFEFPWRIDFFFTNL